MLKLIIKGFLILYPVYLSAQDPTGYLKLDLNIDSVYVLVNNNFVDWQKLASGDSIELMATGNYVILSTPYDAPLKTLVKIPENSTYTLSHSFASSNINTNTIKDNLAARIHFNANVMVLTDEDSEIYYKGDFKGRGFAKFNAPEELGDLEIINPDFGTYKTRLNIRERRVNLIEMYRRPSKTSLRSVSIFPGASQFYKKQYLKGALFSASSTILLTYTIGKFTEYENELYKFNTFKINYSESSSESEALEWGDRTDKQRILVRNLDNQRRLLLAATLFLYSYNIYDAFTSKPKGGYQKKEKDLKFYLSQEKISGISRTTGTIRYNF